MSSNLFTQIQNELRRYKTSGIDLAHPQGVMIGEKLYPALHKVINLDTASNPFHYPSFQIPHESGNRTQVVGSAFGGTENVGPTHLILGLVHPETEYGYYDREDVEHPSHTRVHRGLEHSWEDKPEVQEAKWTWTTKNTTKYHKSNNPYAENESTMVGSLNHESIHNLLEEHAKEPHHSRILRYVYNPVNGGRLIDGGKGWQTLQSNMDLQDLQNHTKQSFRQHHRPHIISINPINYSGDANNDNKTTHLYNVKTEELTPYDSHKDIATRAEFSGY